ncbi:MAG: type IV pilus assembly protein PilM [Lutisporaceae bacterium]
MTHKSVISIDIGSCKTKIVLGRQESSLGLVIVEKAFVLDTPKGCINDGKLFMTNEGTKLLKQSILQVLSQYKIKTKDAIFTIQSTNIIRRELEIPRVKNSELENMIKYEIEQYLPIDLNEYIVVQKLVEDKKDSNNNKMRILIAAMPKELTAEYLKLTNILELSPIALDINSNSITKLFTKNQSINDQSYDIDKTIALIDLGYSNINISIVSGGLFQFSKLIPYGGSELTAAVAKAFDISIEESQKKINLEADLSVKIEEGEVSLNAILSDIIYMWNDDLERVFQYYKTRGSNNKIDEIYLYGGVSNIKGLVAYLSSASSLPVNTIKEFANIKIDKHCDKIDIKLFLNALGAIIRK